MRRQKNHRAACGSGKLTLFAFVALWCFPLLAASQEDDSGLFMITDPVTSKVMPRKKVLVTGAAGFVGSHVADYLLARGDDVVIVDEVNDYYDVNIKEGNLRMLQQKYSASSVSIYRGDIADDVFMKQVFNDHRFDTVCHMAARAGVRPSIQNPFIYVRSNILGTVKLMELAVKHKVQNFVFASSSSVYGGSKSTYFSELERVDNPISPYAATKKSCELFSYVYQHVYDLNVTALRFFTVYGPRGRPDMAPFMFVDRVSRGLHIQQFGDGTSSRDYTYVDDIVQGVVRSVDAPTPYQILNLGKGSGTVLKEFLGMVEKYVGKAAIVDILPDQPGDVPYTCANVTLAHEHLGYQATVPFEEGIQRTVQWYKEAFPGRRNEASAATAKKRSFRRRVLLEQVLEEPYRFRRFVRRAMMKDSTAFDGEDLRGDEEWFEALLEAKDRRRRKLQGNDEPSWEETPAVAPHTEHKKVLVTGGAGFIGSHVADFLLARGDSVVVVDARGGDGEANLNFLQEKYGSTGKLAIYHGDVCEADFMEKIFVEEKPEWICHLAARSNVASSLIDPDYIHSVEGTVRLLELSKGGKFGGHTIRNFVLASSNAVYGSQTSRNEIDTHPIVRTEADRVDYPKTPYGASKKAAELLAYTYHHLYQFPISALRLFDVYGPRYRPDMEPFHLIDRMFSDRDISQFTANTISRDYTYIDDVVQGIVRALDRPYGYEIFNVGSGRESCRTGLAVQEFVRLAAQSAGMLAEVADRVLAEVIASAKSVDGISCADVRKAEHLLDYKAVVSLQEGIYRTVAWHQQTYYPDATRPQPTDDGTDEATVDDAFPWVQEEAAVPLVVEEPHETPQQPWSSSTDEAEHAAKMNNSLLSPPTTKFVMVQNAVPKIATKKVKYAEEETYFSNFPAWLRSLAFLQWLLVVSILFARAYFKSPIVLFGRLQVDELCPE